MNFLFSMLLSTIAIQNPSSQDTVSARVYNPSCPLYFSVLQADILFHKSFERELFCKDSSIRSVELVYSYRNAWTRHSWDREVAGRAAVLTENKDADTRVPKASDAQQQFWSLSITGEEVASRSSYQFTHIEFAWKLVCENNHLEWDNGGQAPMGFYSAALPSVRCPMSDFVDLSVNSLASSDDYI